MFSSRGLPPHIGVCRSTGTWRGGASPLASPGSGPRNAALRRLLAFSVYPGTSDLRMFHRHEMAWLRPVRRFLIDDANSPWLVGGVERIESKFDPPSFRRPRT